MTSAYAIPNGIGISDNQHLSQIGVDLEERFGIDDRSDYGVRLTSFSGLVASYMRRLNGKTMDSGAVVSVMVGGGLVNSRWLHWLSLGQRRLRRFTGTRHLLRQFSTRQSFKERYRRAVNQLQWQRAAPIHEQRLNCKLAGLVNRSLFEFMRR